MLSQLVLFADITSYMQNWTLLAVLFLVVGLGLVIVEMITPGFGLPGITGGVLLLITIIMMAKSVESVLVTIAIILVLLAIAAFIVFRSMDKGKLSKTAIVLHETIDSTPTQITDDDLTHLIGTSGIAMVDLRPSGFADFSEKRYDVITRGDFIKKGEELQVVAIEGTKIVVERKKA